jgi:hypothetical protein
MEMFRILLIDRTGHVLGVDEIEAASDQDAIDRTLAGHHCGVGYGYEIWQDNRQVCAHFESRLSHH